MKKFFILITVTSILLCMAVGCAKSSNSNTQNQDTSIKEEPLTREEPATTDDSQNELRIEQTISEEVVGINILPTEAATYIQYGWGYYIPENQKLWKEKWDEAYSHVSTINTTPIPWGEFLPVGINLGNELGFLLHKDGSLWFLDLENNYIAPEDARELYSMVLEVMEKIGMNPVAPEEIQGVTTAILSINNETHVLTDPESLLTLEKVLNQATLVKGLMTRCPFTSMLTLTMGDGVEVTIAIAVDECGLWMSDGLCYEFADTSKELYALFGVDLAETNG